MAEKHRGKKPIANKTHKPTPPAQPELPGTPPDSERGRLTKLYAEQRKSVNDSKSEMYDTERKISAELKKEKRRDVKANGFKFEIRSLGEELHVQKI